MALIPIIQPNLLSFYFCWDIILYNAPFDNYNKFLGLTLYSELKTIEDSNTRWEAHFPLEDSFVGNPSSVRVFKKNSNIIIEKKVPIPNEVQLATVSAYMKGTFLSSIIIYTIIS